MSIEHCDCPNPLALFSQTYSIAVHASWTLDPVVCAMHRIDVAVA